MPARSLLIGVLLLWLGQGVAAQNIPGLTGPAQEYPGPERRWAVLVGVSEYQHLPESAWLLSCDNDAEALAKFLASPRGGAVPESHMKLLLNDQATARNIRLALDFVITKAAPGDIVTIFFAGHGKVRLYGSGEVAYLLPYDAEPEFLNATAIPMDEIHRYVDVHLRQASQVVMITDACHAGALVPISSNPTDTSSSRRLSSISEHLQAVGEREGVLNLMACRRDEVAIEDSRLGDHGVLTYTLLKALSGEARTGRRDVVRTQDLLEYVMRYVPRLTNQRQHPRHNSNYLDEFPLAFLDREGPDLDLPEAPGSHFDSRNAVSVFDRTRDQVTLRVVGAQRDTELYLVRGQEQRTVGRVLSSSNILVTSGLQPGTYTLVQTGAQERKEWEILLDDNTETFDIRSGVIR